MQSKKAILLHLPIAMVEQLDAVTEVMRMNRSDVIRRSLARDLEFINSVELKQRVESELELNRLYNRWSLTMAL